MLLPYNLQDLQNDLQVFVINMRSFNKRYASIFDMQFKTGLRIGECVQHNRFVFLDSPHFKIITEKGSNDRIFNYKDFDAYFQDMYLLEQYPFPYCSESVASYFFRHYYKYSQVYVENKGITTHLFRHCIVKFWHELGFDNEYIAEQLGEKDVKNIKLYINSKLYYNPLSSR